MDRRTLQEYLAAAEVHIEDGRLRVARQAEIVAQLKDDDRHAAMANDLLQRFKVSLSNFIQDRDLIIRFLENLD